MGSHKKIQEAVLSQSIFKTVYIPSRSWRSYATSSVIHGALILVLLLITFPVIREQIEEPKVTGVTLVAPVPPRNEQQISSPRHVDSPKLVARTQIKPRVLPPLKPTPVKPVPVTPKISTAAPELRVNAISPVRPLPQLRPEPLAPKPQVRTGTFETADAARNQLAPRELRVGGFGDPNGVPPSTDSRPSPATIAPVGSFDLPPGAGHSGGGGQNTAGGLRQTSFGSVGESGVPGGTGHSGGTVHTGAFGEQSTAPQQIASSPRPRAFEPVFTPVEILFKPKPAYTDEARNLKLEGQVSIDVVFLSTGSIRILRVVHGLGHGLDEAAQQAALQVRFRPATRGGVPVDTSATIHITFQLT